MTASDTEPRVTLVIPARNAAGTLGACLDAAVPLLERGELADIILVDDGSSDATVDIAAEHSVRCIAGPGRGPGAARNAGWREAHTPFIWFIDADCVAEPDALLRLLPHLNDHDVAGVGGSYTNLCTDSLLASLIHEEICLRHREMPQQVNFLGSYNVVYRRHVLEQIGGFDEREFNAAGSPGAEDAELAFRIIKAGHRLHFEQDSCVGHFHPTRLLRYLRSQRHHGYWRVFLYRRHADVATGDSYSGLVDHVQPPLAMLLVVTLPLLAWPGLWWVPVGLVVVLLAAQLPVTIGLLRATRQLRYAAFVLLGFVRAFARGFGMTAGMFVLLMGDCWKARKAKGRLESRSMVTSSHRPADSEVHTE